MLKRGFLAPVGVNHVCVWFAEFFIVSRPFLFYPFAGSCDDIFVCDFMWLIYLLNHCGGQWSYFFFWTYQNFVVSFAHHPASIRNLSLVFFWLEPWVIWIEFIISVAFLWDYVLHLMLSERKYGCLFNTYTHMHTHTHTHTHTKKRERERERERDSIIYSCSSSLDFGISWTLVVS